MAWVATKRSFFRRDDYVEEANRQRGEQSLGLTIDLFKQLAESQRPVLEIGPGYFESTRDLENLGVNLTVIEPSLREGDDVQNLQKLLLDKPLKSRILAIKANELTNEDSIQDNYFYLAFAVGPNFQNYQLDCFGFLNEIKGVFKKLSIDGRLVMEVKRNPEGQAALNFIAGRFMEPKLPIHSFDLQRFLNYIDAKYQVNFSEDGNTNSITIYKLNEYSEDLYTKLMELTPEQVEQFQY